MRHPRAAIPSLIFLCAVFSLPGCGDGRAFEQAQTAERSGRYHAAYDKYCRIAKRHPGNGSVAAAIRRVRPQAAAFWAEHAREAGDAGRHDDAWRMWMRVLSIEPGHQEAVSHIHQLERNHLMAIRDAKADWLAYGARTLAVRLPEEPETRVAARQEEPAPVAERGVPKPEPVRIASIPTPKPEPEADATEATPQEKRVALVEPAPRQSRPSPSRNSVTSLAPAMRRSAPRIVPPARPHPRIATAPIASERKAPVPRNTNTAPRQPQNNTPTPRANTLVPEPAQAEAATPARVASAAPWTTPVITEPETRSQPFVAEPLTGAASVPETADLAHAHEAASEAPGAPGDAATRDKQGQTEIAARPEQTKPAAETKPIAPIKPSPKPRIATTADQKKALATSKTNVSRSTISNRDDETPKGFGEFLVLHTLSREDRRYPKYATLIDGVDAKLKDTDGDLDADINLYIGNKRIKKIRELGIDRSATFRGHSGKRYRLVVLSIHHKTHTVRLGIKPA